MIAVIDAPIETECLEKLVGIYNSLGEDETLTLYFSSEGGENSVGNAMIHLINENADRTKIVAFRGLYSYAFMIFFAVKCQKEIMDYTIAMYHLTRIPAVPIYEGNVTANDESLLHALHNLRDFSLLNQVSKLVKFTKKELDFIKSNKDFFVPKERLVEMLEYNLKYLKIK